MIVADVITPVRQRLHDFISQVPDTSLLASDVIGDVRDQVKDTDSGNYRVSQAQLIIFINDGQQYVREVAPWLLFGTDGTPKTFSLASATTDTLFTPARFRAALVQYVVYRYTSYQEGDKYNAAMAKAALQGFADAAKSQNWRWPNATLLRYLNMIMLEVYQGRGHLQWADNGTVTAFAAITVSDTIPGTTLCLPDRAQQTLIAGVTFMALQQDFGSPVLANAAKAVEVEYRQLLGSI